MRGICRWTALCLALLYLTISPALAQVPFLVHSADWSLANTPLDVRLTADVSAHMPFDDDRLATLTPIIDLLSLRIVTGEAVSGVTISMEDQELLTLLTSGDAAWLSCLPDVSFTADADAVSLLLGEETTVTDVSFFGVRAEAETLLEDGEALLTAIPSLLADYGKPTRGQTKISGMGTAQYRWDYTVPAEAAEQVRDMLIGACPDGWLKSLLSSLTLTGKQTLRMYYTADDQLLRAEYNGSCGVGDDRRTVNLVWRMCRTDDVIKDDLTLTSPAKTGSNKNSLTFTRNLTRKSDGTIELTGEFAYTVTQNKLTDVRKGEFSLTNAWNGEADVITGHINFRRLEDGDSKYGQLELEPSLTIGGTAEAPVITGTLTVREMWGKNDREEAVLHVSATRAEPLNWPESAETIDLSALDEERLAQVQALAESAVTTAIVRPILLRLGADAEWFFQDLPADAVQSILDAVRETH